MKRFFSLILIVGLIVSLCSVNVLAVEYNTTENGEMPFEVLDLTNSTYVDYMNGASSEKVIGISNRYFKTTTNSCYLNVCEVDTNGTQGTVTFTVKNKENGEIIKDANGLLMVYSFTSDSKGSLASADVKEIVFSTPTPFYFEISTSNPTSTRCYGHYVVTEGPLKEITANAYLEGKVKNLIELGIVEGDPDGNLRLDENITRAEFTKVICKALNAAPAPTSVAPYFSDVDANFWAFGYIETARQYGLIKGYGDEPYHPTFKPYNNITYSESFKMIVEMLGYGLFAEDLGGFPDGYKTVALQDLELFRAFVPDYSAPITRGELFEIVYNALDVPIVEVYHRTNREFKIMNGAYDDCPLLTLRMKLSDVSDVYISVPEKMTLAQAESLQRLVNYGNEQWRKNPELVAKNFLSDYFSSNWNNAEIISLHDDGEKFTYMLQSGKMICTIELFKPVDKTENGIWVVESIVNIFEENELSI